jgi:hypothetical protein
MVVKTTLGDELSLIQRTIMAVTVMPNTDAKTPDKVTQGHVMTYLGISPSRGSGPNAKSKKKSAKKGMNAGNISVSASS